MDSLREHDEKYRENIIHPKKVKENPSASAAQLSLITAIGGLFFFGIILGPIAVISAITGIKTIKNQKWKNVCFLALFLGLIDILLSVLNFMSLFSYL